MCLFLPSLSFVKILGFNSLFFVQIGLEVNIYLVANSLEKRDETLQVQTLQNNPCYQ